MPFMPGKQPSLKQLIALRKSLRKNPGKPIGRTVRLDKPHVRVLKIGKSTVTIKTSRGNHFPVLQLKSLNRYYKALSKKKGRKYALRKLRQYFAGGDHYVYEYVGAPDAEILSDYISGRLKDDVLCRRALRTFERQRLDLFKGLSKFEPAAVKKFGVMVGEAIQELKEHMGEVAYEEKFVRNPDLSKNNFLVIGMEPNSNRVIISVKDQPYPSIIGGKKDSGTAPVI